MTTDPEGNLWFSNVTRNDASFTYCCYAESLIKYLHMFNIKTNNYIILIISNKISLI